AAGWEYRTSSSGSWTAGSGSSFTLAPGSYAAGQVQVRQTDLAGNTSVAASNGATISIDQSVAAPSLALANDTGSSASDGLSSDGTVNVSLALDVASWEYRTSSSGSWTAGSGSSFVLAPGSYATGDIQVRQTDLAGNVSAAGANASALAILTAPAAPGVALASDTGASATDGVSALGTVNVTLAPGASWEYRTSSDGAWTAGSGSSFTLAPGSYAAGEIQVRQTDLAGNTSVAASNGATVSIDQSVDAPSLVLASDTGSSASDGLSSDGTVNVALALDAAGWEYRTSSNGSWTTGSGSSFTLAPGSYAAGQVQVRQTDLAGNTSAAAINGATISIDQSVAAPSLALANDTGSSASDGLSSDGTVTVSLAPDAAGWEYRTSSNGSWTA
ncbi:hypothetical protein LCI23_20440, partial [Massilia sp. MS-15]